MVTRIIMAGGTGLVGGLLTARLRRRPDVTLDSLVRNPRQPGERKVDFAALAALPTAPADVAICCLGTTRRAAGSAAAFRRVDHDYVLAFARLARDAGAHHFIMVSSVGAGGRGLYLATKGEAEAGVAALGFDRVDTLRPSLLLGPRAERRPGEWLAQRIAPMLDPLLAGPLGRYAALDAAIVAAAIDRLTTCTAPGVYRHHVPDIRRLAS